MSSKQEKKKIRYHQPSCAAFDLTVLFSRLLHFVLFFYPPSPFLAEHVSVFVTIDNCDNWPGNVSQNVKHDIGQWGLEQNKTKK